jgi:nucleotide-binding universal stress UspA family protein
MRRRFPPLRTGPPEGAVIVGVGLDRTDAAIHFAAAEACLTGRPLHLLHVLRLSPAQADPWILEGAADAADEALEQALALAEEQTAGRVPVTAERIDDGRLVADIVRRTHAATVLVLQHRRLSRWERLVTGSTVAGVASRCAVPVVSVPDDWTPLLSAPRAVTVGVQVAEEAGPLLRRALEMARHRDASVVVLHAWWLTGGYDSVVADHAYIAKQAHAFNGALAPTVAAARAEFADVPVSVRVQHDPPVKALLDAVTGSQLLVIGRRHHELPLGSHLGPVARAVLRDAAGPVLVNPELPLSVPESTDEAKPGKPQRVRTSHPHSLPVVPALL